MLEVEKEMYIQSLFKKNNYIISNRNYLSDYSKIKSKKIDMTLSGKYLSDYGNLKIDSKKFDKYPSHIEIKKLENEIKNNEKIDKEIILGSGANGILQNLVKIFFQTKGNLVTPFYTFNQVEYAVTSFGCKTRRVYTDNYKINFSKMKNSINNKTRMVYLCNPNNPTGIYEKCYDILTFAKSVKVPVIVDESGIEFTNKESLLNFNLPDNLLVVRSFSKAYGIANLRIGYLICSKNFKQRYIENVTTNEFSGLSCIIATELLKNGKYYIKKNIKFILEEKKHMVNELKKLGIIFIKSKSNILMTESTFNEKTLKLLEDNNVSIVPIYDEFDNIHIRIAIQDPKTNKKFIDTFTKIIENNNLKSDN